MRKRCEIRRMVSGKGWWGGGYQREEWRTAKREERAVALGLGVSESERAAARRGEARLRR